jgi:hypothetical protein
MFFGCSLKPHYFSVKNIFSTAKIILGNNLADKPLNKEGDFFSPFCINIER